jgi:hypothetical protein
MTNEDNRERCVHGHLICDKCAVCRCERNGLAFRQPGSLLTLCGRCRHTGW